MSKLRTLISGAINTSSAVNGVRSLARNAKAFLPENSAKSQTIQNLVENVAQDLINNHKTDAASKSRLLELQRQKIIDEAKKRQANAIEEEVDKFIKSQKNISDEAIKEKEVLIVGYGKMTQAMLQKWCEVPNVKFTIVNPTTRKTPEGAEIEYHNSSDGIKGKKFDAIIFGIKPQNFEAVVPLYKGNLGESGVVVSIAAGVTTDRIWKLIQEEGKVAVVRVMPNLAALVGKSVNAWTKNEYTSKEQSEFVENLMAQTGSTLEVSEDKMNGVTAVSGSGPAYLAKFMQAWVKGAKEVGFTSEEARELVLGTVIGTAAFLQEEIQDPSLDEVGRLENFIKSVTSKGGTTEAAFREGFANGEFEKCVMEAVKAAKARGDELSGGGGLKPDSKTQAQGSISPLITSKDLENNR